MKPKKITQAARLAAALSGRKPPIQEALETAIHIVSRRTGYDPQSLIKGERDQSAEAPARHAVRWLLLQEGFSPSDLAHEMDLNHASITHSRDTIKDLMDVYPDLKQVVDECQEEFRRILEERRQKIISVNPCPSVAAK